MQATGVVSARYAGHSLWAGFMPAVAHAGADVWKSQQVSRRKSMQVLAGYVRDAACSMIMQARRSCNFVDVAHQTQIDSQSYPPQAINYFRYQKASR